MKSCSYYVVASGICLSFFAMLFLSSCLSKWKKIGVDVRSPSTQYAFTLQTGNYAHNLYKKNNVVQIITGVDDNNRACIHALDSNSDDVKEVENLIQQIVDLGEFTAHRPFHKDSFEDYYMRTSSSTPKIILTIQGNTERIFVWYYQHDKELEESGMRKIAVELDEIFRRIKNEIKNMR